jgi:hypothetical protein
MHTRKLPYRPKDPPHSLTDLFPVVGQVYYDSASGHFVQVTNLVIGRDPGENSRLGLVVTLRYLSENEGLAQPPDHVIPIAGWCTVRAGVGVRPRFVLAVPTAEDASNLQIYDDGEADLS